MNTLTCRIVTLMILLSAATALGDGPRVHREWRRGDQVTASDWNRMVTQAGCPGSTAAQGDPLAPLAWSLVECFARRLGEREAESFAKLASAWWR